MLTLKYIARRLYSSLLTRIKKTEATLSEAKAEISNLAVIVGGKQASLVAGQNIVINGNTISAVIDAGFNIEIVQALPSTGVANTIYFVPITNSTSPNLYDEYMYINGVFEKIGSTEIDLSNYYNKSEIETLLDAKQDTVVAGQNIEITEGTLKSIGYRFNAENGAFAEGDRSVLDDTTTINPSVATGAAAAVAIPPSPAKPCAMRSSIDFPPSWAISTSIF